MMTDKNEFDLDAYFKAGRTAGPVPSADLVGRIMADADMQMAVVNAAPNALSRQQGFFASLWDAIGRWPTLVGLATAGVFGVWIGFSQPAGLDLVADQIWGAGDASYLVDLMPVFGDEFEEG